MLREDPSDLFERVGKQVIICAEPGNDVTGRVLPSLGDRCGLAPIAPVSVVSDVARDGSEQRLNTRSGGCIKNGEFERLALCSQAGAGSWDECFLPEDRYGDGERVRVRAWRSLMERSPQLIGVLQARTAVHPG